MNSELQPRANSSYFSKSADEFRQQWTQPTDVFSVLLLLGGEIVNKALAQLAGGVFTPVTFSFGITPEILCRQSLFFWLPCSYNILGWVSYAVKTFLASVGDAVLMPSASEGSCLVITAKNGYLRSNTSWVIGRMLRDYEYWMDTAVRARLEKILNDRQRYMRQNTKAGTQIPKPGQTGLCISVYEPSETKAAGEPTLDLIYWSGLAVAFVQLVISAIPIATSGNWSILMITIGGTVFALITGSLPQWRAEKWVCRRSSPNTYILTPGNGAQHAIVILGNGRGLNLEDLAVAGQMNYPSSNILTRLGLAVISILWISLLIAAAGVRKNTWYLLAVGGIGILQNVLVAGWRRDPSALGVHLEFRRVIGEMTTMDALLALEAEYTRLGRSLLPIFFPGELLPNEVARWEALTVKAVQDELARPKAQGKPTTTAPESWVAHARTFEKG